MATDATAVVFLIAVLVNVGVALLVYQDARTRSSQSAVLWALVVMGGGFLLGGLLYVLLGRDRPSSSLRRHSRRSGASEESDDEPMNVDDGGPF